MQTQRAENSKKDAVPLVQSVIICPTPEGGHIEHAADVGVALFEETGVMPILLTRPGARNYLPNDLKRYISIKEVLPPLSSAVGARKVIDLMASLIKEHVTLRAILRGISTENIVMIMEEPRYPFPSLLANRANFAAVLIMHNAVSHSLQKSGSERVKDIFGALCLRHVDRVIVHGDRQLQTVQSQTSVTVTSSPLPTTSRLPGMMDFDSEIPKPRELLTVTNFYACVGEIRENKGIELAIAAVKGTNVSLVIAGKAVDPDYLNRLKDMTHGARNITFIDRFLEVPEFEFLLRNADCILLPYSHFEAQSGVLARAMSLGKPVIATRLPALEEQGFGYENIRFFARNDQRRLNELLTEGVAGARNEFSNTRTGSQRESGTWSQLARILLGTEER